MDFLLNLYRGRIGRKNYILGGILIFIATALTMLLVGAGVLAGLAWLVSTYLTLSLHVRRLHDINQSGWLVLIFLIPLINFFFWLWLIFAPTKDKENEHGKNTDGKTDFLDSVFNLKYKK